MSKLAIFFLLSIPFFLMPRGCSTLNYVIDENNLTYQDPSNARLYLDIEAIDLITEGKKTFEIKTRDPIFIKSHQELKLKKGWTLKGEQGNELMVKEFSSKTAAIQIKNSDKISISNFQLKMDSYTDMTYKKGLINIDNERGVNNLSGFNDDTITISNLILNNHYSAIWIKRGQNINIVNCKLEDNAHQIYLGNLEPESLIPKYKVDQVKISGCKIINSKGGNVNGIKALSNCTGIEIIDNLIAGNNQDGIDLYPGGLEVLIKQNTIRDNKVHGIEVKMANRYTPTQTGQIKKVVITENVISNNLWDGIACLDEADDYYAKGIIITDNIIDSSGNYGIRSELPINITSNRLRHNGLFPNLTDSTNHVGYTGILLLSQRQDSASLINKNTIIDQAPISGINATYWLTVTGVKSFTKITDNKFIISNKSSSTTNIDKYGIGMINATNLFDSLEIVQQNEFSNGFIRNLLIGP